MEQPLQTYTSQVQSSDLEIDFSCVKKDMITYVKTYYGASIIWELKLPFLHLYICII